MFKYPKNNQEETKCEAAKMLICVICAEFERLHKAVIFPMEATQQGDTLMSYCFD